ncbi:CaiB/BaiF CoA-transferase family protein [Hydrogenophaga sp.]|uniref:CaiB/BaiF CoA transferase family protein n=1 Tax=Hydrogenophaga sp. TaxID=1904254 RepID=UPI00271C5201|nr:CoA transferase [Hydrogenophaga sp.]MDO9437511.1 CoA transferase [Hydrogenophaga sp.]
MAQAKKRPLEGIRVLEIASMIFGPLAGQYLGDMGAEVIKLEPPEGDLTRHIGPRRSPRMGAFFMTSNRNKRSIVVDLKRPEGLEILQRLLAETDVLIHSMRTPAATRLGLDYPALAEKFPALVYCHVTGYGDDGLYAGRPAYDDIIQAASGLAMLQTVVGGQPRFIPTIVADKISGLHAAYAIMAALMHRAGTGEGQQVDVPMFATMAAFNLMEHPWGHTFEPPLGPMGYESVSSAARRPYKTQDGFLALLPYSDSHWRRFFELAGAAQVMEDPRFATFAARQKNVKLVWAEIERQVGTKTNDEWLRLLSAEDIPFSVVNSLEDLPNDPHLNSVDFWQILEHPTEGALRVPRSPMQLSASPADITRLPPNLGQHSADILRACGYGDAEIEQLTLPGGACAAAD